MLRRGTVLGMGILAGLCSRMHQPVSCAPLVCDVHLLCTSLIRLCMAKYAANNGQAHSRKAVGPKGVPAVAFSLKVLTVELA